MHKPFPRCISDSLAIIASFSLGSLMLSEVSVAQIRPDSSLPQNSTVRSVGSQRLIENGTTAGTNLFHSFESFSVPEGITASFENATAIRNIFTRITGPNQSRVFGTLKSAGSANLYFQNPNGIIFGPNAELRLGGSFFATTSDAIQFGQGLSFSSVSPENTPILSMTAPVGLQFGNQPQPIQVQGTGNQLVVAFPFIDQVGPISALEVQSGRSLALLGGGIQVQGGNLAAPDGQIQLGSVGANSEVAIAPKNRRLNPNFDNVSSFEPVELSQAASINTSGNGAGSILLQGSQISVSDGSTLLARPLLDGTSSGITVNASEVVAITGFSEDAFGPAFPSSFLTDVPVGSAGSGGKIQINAPNLFIMDGAFISSGTFDLGNAGSVNVKADLVELIGDGPFGSSGIFGDTFAPGTGGNITIKAQELFIADGAQISSSTLFGNPAGFGQAGQIDIDADLVTLSGGSFDSGPSGLFSNVETSESGGEILVKSDRLEILDGAEISTTSFDLGNAGDIKLWVNQLLIDGSSPNGFAGGVFSNAEFEGNSGQIQIRGKSSPRSQTITLAGGGQIATNTFDRGQAGQVMIRADQLQLLGDNTPRNGTTGILSSVERNASGQGGSVSLNVKSLELADGAQVAVGTKGTGNAGNLSIQAETVLIQGGDRAGRSGLFVNALESTGDSGNISVVADQVSLEEGATINASNFVSRDPFSASGQGAAGNIVVEANTLELQDQSIISAATGIGDRGNITLTGSLLQLSDQSAITANASGPATGGNVTLSQDIIAASGNSDISANSTQNFGGQITIQTQGIFGTEFREAPTERSDITASSTLGPSFSGLVEITTPDANPSQNLVPLSGELVDPRNRVRSSCQPGNRNSLVVSNSSTQTSAWNPAAQTLWFQEQSASVSAQPNRQPKKLASSTTVNPIVINEAQGWKRNQEGHLKMIGTEIQRPLVKSLKSCLNKRPKG